MHRLVHTNTHTHTQSHTHTHEFIRQNTTGRCAARLQFAGVAFKDPGGKGEASTAAQTNPQPQ